MNTEQLKNYIDILHDEVMMRLNIIMTFEMERAKEERPAIMADLQKMLNDTRRQDFNDFIKEDKNRKRRQQRHDAYAEFFERPNKRKYEK